MMNIFDKNTSVGAYMTIKKDGKVFLVKVLNNYNDIDDTREALQKLVNREVSESDLLKDFSGKQKAQMLRVQC